MKGLAFLQRRIQYCAHGMDLRTMLADLCRLLRPVKNCNKSAVETCMSGVTGQVREVRVPEKTPTHIDWKQDLNKGRLMRVEAEKHSIEVLK